MPCTKEAYIVDEIGAGPVSMAEEWRPVVGYDGSYSVSSHGRVRSEPRIVSGANGSSRRLRGKLLARRFDNDGYVHVALGRDGRVSYLLAHRLVAEAFIGKIPDGMEINHINGRVGDNGVWNLEIVTPSENVRHAFATGLRSGAANRCERNGMARLCAADVLWAREECASGRSTQKDVAARLGVSRAAVNHIINRRCWTALLPSLQPQPAA